MRVLVACEYSATVRDAFRAKGHDAWSCDLLPTDGDPQWHHEGDITDILYRDWGMLIAHPPLHIHGEQRCYMVTSRP